MSQDVQHCPLCGGERSSLFDRRLFRGHEVINCLCENCGLVYQSPRMTEAESVAFYAREYRLLYEGSADPTTRNTSVQRARAESLAAFAQPHIQKLARHLDIGCSLGILLQRFEDTYHCQPVGIEPGEAHRDYARKAALTIYATLEELEKHEKDRFDLVSMSHVLEHLPDPVEYLMHLREKILSPGGWLLLEVPNLYAHDSFEIAHIVSYSTHTLAQTVRKAGFYIRKLERHGRPRSNIIPYYLTLLAQPASKTCQISGLRPEKCVRLKRQLGMLRRRILSRCFPSQAWIPFET